VAAPAQGGGTTADAGGGTTADAGGDATADAGGDATADAGGDATTDAGGDATTDAAGGGATDVDACSVAITTTKPRYTRRPKNTTEGGVIRWRQPVLLQHKLILLS
jgi:hypothetical protein